MALTCPFCRRSLEEARIQQGGGRIMCPSCGNRVQTPELFKPAAVVGGCAPEPLPPDTVPMRLAGGSQQRLRLPLWARALSLVSNTVATIAIVLWLIVGLLLAIVTPFGLPIYLLVVCGWLWWRSSRLAR